MANKQLTVNQVAVELRAAAQDAILRYAIRKKYSKDYIREAHETALRYINNVINKLNAGETFKDFNANIELVWHINIVNNRLRILVTTFEDDGVITNARDWSRYMAIACDKAISA